MTPKYDFRNVNLIVEENSHIANIFISQIMRVHVCLDVYTWCLQYVSRLFFVQVFKIVVDSWKFSVLLLYILWNDWPIFMISGSNKRLHQELEYTLLKPDCQS